MKKVEKGNLKILTLAPFYRWFTKGFIEGSSEFIKVHHVLLRYNRLAKLSSFLPFKFSHHIKMYSRKYMARFENKPNNIKTHMVNMIYFTPDGRNKNLPSKLIKKYKDYIKKNNIHFDLIHAHFIWPQGFIGVHLGEFFNCPVVITLHENMKHYNLIKKNIGMDKINYIFDNADFFIRVNKKDIPLFINDGITSNKIASIPNGFDTNKFTIIPKQKARNKLILPHDKKILFNLARLDDVKGQKYLIDSMKMIVKDYQNVHCYIGGNGPLKEVLQKQIIHEGLKEYITLLGYVSEEKINYWMNASDLFILPSLDEGNPTVMFESLGIGLPFIGTKVGGIPEIITSEDYGLLVNPADPKDLSKKIIQGLNKKWDTEKIKSYGKQFTWKNIASDTVALYMDVIKDF